MNVPVISMTAIRTMFAWTVWGHSIACHWMVSTRTTKLGKLYVSNVFLARVSYLYTVGLPFQASGISRITSPYISGPSFLLPVQPLPWLYLRGNIWP